MQKYYSLYFKIEIQLVHILELIISCYLLLFINLILKF